MYFDGPHNIKRHTFLTLLFLYHFYYYYNHHHHHYFIFHLQRLWNSMFLYNLTIAKTVLFFCLRQHNPQLDNALHPFNQSQRSTAAKQERLETKGDKKCHTLKGYEICGGYQCRVCHKLKHARHIHWPH